nr:hypothetical protein [Magnetospira sp. QH-2]
MAHFAPTSVETIDGSGFALSGDAGANTLDFSSVTTWTNVSGIYGGGGGDVIVGSSVGDALIDGGVGNDTITGGAGNDAIDGGTGTDTAVFSGNLEDYAFAEGSGYFTVTGADGTDVLTGIEKLAFDDGTYDLVYGDDLANTLNGTGASPSLVVGFDGDDDMTGGSMDDVLLGGLGNDTLDGGDGADWIQGGIGDDTIYADGDDEIDGGAGTDVVSLWSGDLGLQGNDGQAQWATVSGVEEIAISTGATLYGVRDLTGQGGNSGLTADLVAASLGVAGGILVVTSHNGDAGASVMLAENEWTDTGNTVTLNGRLHSIYEGTETGGATVTLKVDQALDILGIGTNGTSGDDVIDGTSGVDSINAFAGNDVIDGKEGADILTGGSGADIFHYVEEELLGNGQVGDSITDFVAGSDQIRLEVSNGGNFSLAGSQPFLNSLTVMPYEGNVSGNVILAGPAVSFSAALGNALAQSYSVGYTTVELYTLTQSGSYMMVGPATYTLATSSGYPTGSYTFEGSFQQTIFSNLSDMLANNAGLPVFLYYTDGANGHLYYADGAANSATSYNLVATLEGEPTLSASDIFITEPGIVYTDTVGINDDYHGGLGDDTIFGEAGNDNLHGEFGDDMVSGGAGDDTLFGGSGNNILDGGDDNDRLVGGGDADFMLGGAGADKLEGKAGDDILDGGTGNDTLVGSDGDDMLIGGAGNDTIYGYNEGTGSGDVGSDTVVFSGNSEDYVVVEGTGGAQSVYTVYGADGIDVITGIETLMFDDISTTPAALAFDAVGAGATSGSDLLAGGVGTDTLVGLDGDDQLYGSNGADVLVGGAGEDIFGYALSGLSFDAAEGGDTILDFNAMDDVIGVRTDQLHGAMAYGSVDDLTISQSMWGGNAWGSAAFTTSQAAMDGLRSFVNAGTATWDYRPVFLHYEDASGTGHLLYTESYNPAQANGSQGFDEITSLNMDGDGGVFASDSIFIANSNADGEIQAGDDGLDDVFTGTVLNDQYHGRDGNDTLSGGNGNDILFGDDGVDILSGGGGNDLIHGGYGSDSISGGADSDIFVYVLDDLVNEGGDTIEDFGVGGVGDLFRFYDPLGDANLALGGSSALTTIGATIDGVQGNFFDAGSVNFTTATGTINYLNNAVSVLNGAGDTDTSNPVFLFLTHAGDTAVGELWYAETDTNLVGSYSQIATIQSGTGGAVILTADDIQVF